MIADFLGEVAKLWVNGGACMYPLLLQAAAIYFMGFDLYGDLRGRAFLKTEEDQWAHWIDKPEDGQGEIGEVVRYTQTNVSSLAEIRERFREVVSAYLPPVDRRIRFMFMIIGTAPLTGLLGTVTGMLATFDGIAGGGGGKDTVDLVAGGISEALITTETGLVIAIPGYVLLSHIKRQRDRLQAFFQRMENLTLKRYATRLPAGEISDLTAPPTTPEPTTSSPLGGLPQVAPSPAS